MAEQLLKKILLNCITFPFSKSVKKYPNTYACMHWKKWVQQSSFNQYILYIRQKQRNKLGDTKTEKIDALQIYTEKNVLLKQQKFS